MNDNLGCGRHTEIQPPSNVKHMKPLLDSDCCLSIRDVADELLINRETVRLIVNGVLRLQKLCAKFVSKNLIEEQKKRQLMFAVIGLKQLGQKTFSNVW